jgi:adenylylsulfate kinase
MKTLNTIYHNATITRQRREELNSYKLAIIWLIGLLGSGKSTLTHSVEEELYKLNCRTFVLDGDNLRQRLSLNLTFSDYDRKENIRRIDDAAKLMMEAGVIAITSFIIPFREDRNNIRQLLPKVDLLNSYFVVGQVL